MNEKDVFYQTTEETQDSVNLDQKDTKQENRRTSSGKESKGSRKPKTGKAANSKYVQVRKGPSSSAQVLTAMSLGDRAVILDRLPGYYKIKTENGGYVGYVSSNYFKED